MNKLRQPQREASDALSKTSSDIPQIVVIPTGVGKTTVIALLSTIFETDRKIVLVIVPTLALIEQTSKSIQETCSRCAIHIHIECVESVQHLSTLIESSPSNYQTYWITNIHKLHHLSEISKQRLSSVLSIIAVDEAHHLPASMWKTLLIDDERLKSVRQVLFTATPFRTDGQHLYGTLCYQYTMRQAIIEGYIKHPVLHLHHSSRKEGEEQIDIELLRRTQQLLSQYGGQALGCAKNINHVHQLAQLARIHTPNLRVSIWHSQMNAIDRQRVRNRFENESELELDMVFQVNICSEGYNNPRIVVVTLYKVVRSLLVFMQGLGRALRRLGLDDQLAFIVASEKRCSRSIWERFKNNNTSSLRSSPPHLQIEHLQNNNSNNNINNDEKEEETNQIGERSDNHSNIKERNNNSDDEDEEGGEGESNPWWWVNAFDEQLLLLSSNLISFGEYKRKDEKDDNDNNNNQTMDQIIEGLDDMPACRDEPFNLKTSRLVVVKPPSNDTKRHSRLTAGSIGLARLPVPHNDKFIAFSRYRCPSGKVRELNAKTLYSLLRLSQKRIADIIDSENRRPPDRILPFVSDRLYFHLIELFPSSPSSSKRQRTSSPSSSSLDQFDDLNNVQLCIQQHKDRIEIAERAFQQHMTSKKTLQEALSFLR